ncbi:MAG: CsiV family protein [Gammaproteobacteria bacterium]|nr:CsiV family protein [Gammaproteobacteria bacterium]MDE0443680.1 CsiV family protein [Gammaproteobacteria bacterium]
MNRPTFLLLVAAATWGTRLGAVEAEDFLREDWYRVELIVFEQSPDLAAREGFSTDGIAARTRLLDTVRYPQHAFPLTEATGDAEVEYPFGPPPPIDGDLPVVISNLPPPAWFTGPCGTESWNPLIQPWVHPFEMPLTAPPDPCLPPDPWRMELDGIELAMYQSVPGPAPEAPPDAEPADFVDEVRDGADPRQEAMDALALAFAEYEDQLLHSSYVWDRFSPGFAAERSALARRYDIIAAGNWHQPLPAREQPQPLVIQIGVMDDARRYPLEGLVSVTLGRFVHLRILFEYRLADAGIALISEQRRMRSDEPHYLDHPAIGILARVDPVPLPDDLAGLLDELKEFEQ